MKWSERGPVAWPLIRRSRFVQELGQQREAYEANLLRVEHDLAQERRAHEHDLRNVLDYRHLGMQRHDDYRNDARIFSTRVSNTMIHQISRAANPYKVAEMVCRDLVTQIIEAGRTM